VEDDGDEPEDEQTMCLGVPGRVITIDDANTDASMTMGTVEFGGIHKQVCLACVPEVEVGNYVLAHVGFAIGIIDEDEAQEVFKLLEEMGELEQLELPQPR
jgi:hydrogenase expression/formation protein HypC